MATFFPCQFTAWYTPMAARYISSLLGTYNAMVWASLSRMVATVMTSFISCHPLFSSVGIFSIIIDLIEKINSLTRKNGNPVFFPCKRSLYLV